ncbi:energy-coupling factor transporter transmembrane component T [Bifidobacterium mongoliense]|uniref:energy-coupling factor transporter transmembrane component T n=1 Tax=Bifidobacterium mongoliense TaxID=518643 RepID=UPI001619E89C|nr:energy-coupling factor transporter transmembrane component T [Bifidobacterium mongoliense]
MDPRTKILYVMTVDVFSLGMVGWGSMSTTVVSAVLAFSPLVLLLFSGRKTVAACYGVMVALCYVLSAYALPLLGGALAWMLYASVHILVQMLPCVMSAYWMLATTSASELIAALQRMHVPQPVSMALAVMFRFFPTAVAEQRAINDAMRMRGVRFGGGKASQMFEYRIVPLMTNSVRIADELTQSALTRGLGARSSRTSIAHVGFHIRDACFLVVLAACYATWLLAAIGVLP